MSHISADRDSLVALDALLRIGGSGQSPQKETASTKNNEMIETSTQSSTLGEHKSVKSQASSSQQTRGNAGILLPQVDGNNCSPAQFAAIQAAAGVANGFGNSFVPAGGTFSLHAAAAQLFNRQGGQIHPVVNGGDQKDNSKDANSDAPVRKEKVEAALRSKPQRGRKREDLSEKERLELTRTRNREHAKSTRIRKKARYQELLDGEQKLKRLEKLENLRHKRSDSVLGFLSTRQKMIKNGSVEADYAAAVNTLNEVVCSVSNFQYETSPTATIRINDKQAPANNNSTDIANMRKWDKNLVKRVTRCYGPGAERFVEVKAIGGADGVALSKNGTGFAHVEIVLNVNEPRLLQTSTLSFQFAPESDQIRSATWRTIDEYCAPQEPPKRSRSTAGENLGNVLVHPSVVSLDPDKAIDDEEGHETHAPGMSI